MPIVEYTNSKGLIQKTGTGGLDITEGTLNPTAVPTAGTGITTGTGTVVKHCHERLGSGIIRTSILVDITGLRTSGVDRDIIGKVATANCHLGQVKASTWGTVFGGKLTVLETPVSAGGGATAADIDISTSTASTGTEDAGGATLAGVAVLYNTGENLAAGNVRGLPAPTADHFIYLETGSDTHGAGVYNAGQLLLEFWGTV